MATKEPKIILRDGDYRVLDNGKVYAIEQRNGADGLGVDRWFPNAETEIWPERTGDKMITIPADMFRTLMVMVKSNIRAAEERAEKLASERAEELARRAEGDS
jgi:hypothetical protein